DHFVGDFYVKFNQWAKEDETADQRAQDMLVKWEQGDKETCDLWKMMNGWVYDGFGETYRRFGLTFDTFYYESDTYKLGKDVIQQGLEKKALALDQNGSVEIHAELIKTKADKSTIEALKKPRATYAKPLVRYMAQHKSAAVQAALLENPRTMKEIIVAGKLAMFRYRYSSHSHISYFDKEESNPPMAIAFGMWGLNFGESF
ncbi:MAG: hypothetical protein GY774_33290, partial [Planctomycetes bacterium]|nr:hypothetical protein [Planctomycetota bacterium]